ncbi:hypothetical protein [Synechococcus sp. RS9902]|uniref:hypothetical protein n=1 Tax=Synechococcus sp. RS9902 TaxID=221345 RepID=UPI001862193A|nr:hypothetical protein [Synechococcus sp. RS9902]QNI97991.1 hypothetical protein SynRS9902_02112 [Synechococcus sp. RS9902]
MAGRIETEPLLDESLGSFSSANETTGQKADGWWFRSSGSVQINWSSSVVTLLRQGVTHHLLPAG